jgi:hypothetical protein
MADKSASDEIDDIIGKFDDWRGDVLARLRKGGQAGRPCRRRRGEVEDDPIDVPALKALVKEAVTLNTSAAK